MTSSVEGSFEANREGIADFGKRIDVPPQAVIVRVVDNNVVLYDQITGSAVMDRYAAGRLGAQLIVAASQCDKPGERETWRVRTQDNEVSIIGEVIGNCVISPGSASRLASRLIKAACMCETNEDFQI